MVLAPLWKAISAGWSFAPGCVALLPKFIGTIGTPLTPPPLVEEIGGKLKAFAEGTGGKAAGPPKEKLLEFNGGAELKIFVAEFKTANGLFAFDGVEG